VRLEELGKLKQSNHLIGNRTRDLPACSLVPPSHFVLRRKHTKIIINKHSTIRNQRKKQLRLAKQIEPKLSERNCVFAEMNEGRTSVIN
jgi:hypothetical protein